MKKTNLVTIGLTLILSFWIAGIEAQEAYYKMSPTKLLDAPESKDLRINAVCWSNAGTLFLESELLRLGKGKVALSELAFVHSAYMKKAEIFLQSEDNFSVDPSGSAFDVISLAAEYGMVPESEYFFPDDEMIGSREKEGEMNAIIRGTLQMVKQNEGGQFTERWQNMYSTSLLRYLGEPKRSFTYQKQMLTPVSFVENLGLNLEDYVIITANPDKSNNSKTELETNANWSEQKAYNVSKSNMSRIISEAISRDYSVLWYGAVKDGQIFHEENVAIVPIGSMPTQKPADQEEEIAYEPVAEKVIADEMQREAYIENLKNDQTYMLIHGLMKDQNGKEYFTGKYACKADNNTLTLSEPFITLNTVYLLVNKNSIPDDIRKSLKI